MESASATIIERDSVARLAEAVLPADSKVRDGLQLIFGRITHPGKDV